MRTITRRRGACASCRLRKTRCDGSNPCLTCERSGQHCYYPELAPRHRRQNTHARAPPANNHLSIANGFYGWHCEPQMPPVEDLTVVVASGKPSSAANGTEMNFSMAFPMAQNPRATEAENAMDVMTLDTTYGLATPRDVLSCPLTPVEFSPDGTMTQVMCDMPLSALCESFEDSPFQDNNGAGQLTAPGDQQPSPVTRALTLTPTLTTPSNGAGTVKSLNTFQVQDMDSDRVRESAASAEPVSAMSVDFAEASLYGLPHLFAKVKRTSYHGGIVQKVLTGIDKLFGPWESQAPTNDRKYDEPSPWFYEEATIRRYCDACFETHSQVASFLEREYVDRVIMQSRRPESDEGPEATVFADAILALGLHYSLQNPIATKDRQEAKNRLLSVLGHFKNLQSARNSLLKLQATLLLAIIAYMCDKSLIWECLTSAMQCARDLRLVAVGNQTSSIDELDRDAAERCVLFLYTFESSHSIHQGMYPMLDLDWISRSNIVKRDDDMLAASCSYSELLHSILRLQYSPRALSNTTRTQDRLDTANQLLMDWANKWMPAQTMTPKGLLEMRDIAERDRALRYFCQYHRAVFFIHAPWIMPTEHHNDLEYGAQRCLDVCIESALAVVEVACSPGILADMQGGYERPFEQWRKCYQSLLLAICCIIYAAASGGKEERKLTMACLALCTGLVGKLSLESDEGEVLSDWFELIRLCSQETTS